MYSLQGQKLDQLLVQHILSRFLLTKRKIKKQLRRKWNAAVGEGHEANISSIPKNPASDFLKRLRVQSCTRGLGQSISLALLQWSRRQPGQMPPIVGQQC